MAEKSSNLKNTFVRSLKKSDSIRGLVEKLATRTGGEEVRRIMREGAQRAERRHNMRKEMEEMRRRPVGFSLPRKQKEGDFASTLGPEELKRTIIEQMGLMVDAKLSVWAGKLAPSPSIAVRSPLGNGERSAPSGSRREGAETPKEGRGRIGVVKKTIKKTPAFASEREIPTLADAGREMTTSWTEMVKKEKAKEEKRAAKEAQSSVPKAGPKKPPGDQKAVKGAEGSKKTLAPKRKGHVRQELRRL